MAYGKILAKILFPEYNDVTPEFRSIIGFAEATVLPVKATFSTGGKPITFSIRQEPVIEVYLFYQCYGIADKRKSKN